MKREVNPKYEDDKGSRVPMIFLLVVIVLGLLTLAARGAGLLG